MLYNTLHKIDPTLTGEQTMATGRTVSASCLTDLDNQVLDLCEALSARMIEFVHSDKQGEFKKDYAKISRTRDAGLGRGGGKLQRDALCTRGRQGKAPFSNRNFRWHPLLVADQKPDSAKEIDSIIVEDDGAEASLLVFVTKDQRQYPADLAHTMSEKSVALPSHWLPHVPALGNWSNTQWTQNSCVISAMEAANWWDAVESYAVLGMSIAVNMYQVNFKDLYDSLLEVLRGSTIQNIELPSCKFPLDNNESDIIRCPVCRKYFNDDLGEFRKETRPIAWQPEWGSSKKSEGDDSSIQVMHVNPLIESHMRHNAENVRYGHRWCNVAMTDHSIDETLDFMEHILRAHNRIKVTQ